MLRGRADGCLAPLFGKSLGVKKALITFKIDGKVRSGEIPRSVDVRRSLLCPLLAEGGETGLRRHPVNPVRQPERAGASGRLGSTYADYGLRDANRTKRCHYARSTGQS